MTQDIHAKDIGTLENPVRLSSLHRKKRVEEWVRAHSTLGEGGCKLWSGTVAEGERPILVEKQTKTLVRSWLLKQFNLPELDGDEWVCMRIIGCRNRRCIATGHLVGLRRSVMMAYENMRAPYEAGDVTLRGVLHGRAPIATPPEMEAEIMARREHRQPVREIARALRIGVDRVNEVIAKHAPDIDPVVREKAMRKMREEGVPLEIIGARFGISRKRVSAILAGEDAPQRGVLHVPNFGRVASVFHLAEALA